MMEVKLLDHVIVTNDGYYSFADDGLLGLDGLNNKEEQFVAAIEYDLATKKSHNKTSVEKLAASFGITDKNEVKELTELAIVNRARLLAHSEGTVKERFDRIVELYQPGESSHRTSQSILLQQYSTPAPIGIFGRCVFVRLINFSSTAALHLSLQQVTAY
ncbi:MAG: hypothetical protein IPH18_09095 [Chitinophagaceae bacterium]|nr:hypothetical protein [Chitinophagaceae bacterium]